MTETKKPRFQHVAVNGKNNKTGTKYAKDLEAGMNRLIEAGYAVQLNEQKNFTVIMGVHHGEAPVEHPLARILRAQAELPTSEGPEYTPRTAELLARFERLDAATNTVDEFILAVQKRATEYARGFGAEEIAAAAREVDAACAQHEQHHDTPNCKHVRAMRAVAEALRSVVHQQLQ
jgi:hypothetical protein